MRDTLVTITPSGNGIILTLADQEVDPLSVELDGWSVSQVKLCLSEYIQTCFVNTGSHSIRVVHNNNAIFVNVMSNTTNHDWDLKLNSAEADNLFVALEASQGNFVISHKKVGLN